MTPISQRKKASRKKLTKRDETNAGTGTVSRAYNVPISVIKEIRTVAPAYGSQGRAVQVGSELLVRLPKPVTVPEPDPSTITRKSFKLARRTIELIEELVSNGYSDPGQVFAACMKILRVKKLDSSYLSEPK